MRARARRGPRMNECVLHITVRMCTSLRIRTGQPGSCPKICDGKSINFHRKSTQYPVKKISQTKYTLGAYARSTLCWKGYPCDLLFCRIRAKRLPFWSYGGCGDLVVVKIFKIASQKGYPSDLLSLTHGFAKLFRPLSPSLPDLIFLCIDSLDKSWMVQRLHEQRVSWWSSMPYIWFHKIVSPIVAFPPWSYILVHRLIR